MVRPQTPYDQFCRIIFPRSDVSYPRSAAAHKFMNENMHPASASTDIVAHAIVHFLIFSSCPNVTPLRIPNPLRVRNTEEALVRCSISSWSEFTQLGDEWHRESDCAHHQVREKDNVAHGKGVCRNGVILSPACDYSGE